MVSDNLDIGMGTKARAPRKYAIRAVVFQEGEWLCAQCLPKLCRALQQLIVGHVVVRLRHGQQPFSDLAVPSAA